ncbi:MAG: hypothetical protein KIT84_31850 [Labilithrix sp.]|nr:hypothetical protein [Labilithrix sp.]MCW5815665.1 hypothetical protein [Labilithrix sp.]
MSDEMRRASERIEQLLADLRASIAPAAWARVQELVAALTSVYGEAFARTLGALAEKGPLDDDARARLSDDPVVASVLLLHGLHPVPLEERVARAIEHVRRAAGAEVSSGRIEHGLVAHGVLAVRVTGDWRSSPLGGAGLEAALRRAIEDAAPDLERVEITRDGAFAASPGRDLVQLHRKRPPQADGEEVAR